MRSSIGIFERAFITSTILFAFLICSAEAQVSGISYSLSPSGNAMSWNEQSGLDGGYLYGGQLGFGFGRYVELSAHYMMSYGVKNDVGNINLTNAIAAPRSSTPAEIYRRRDADITRYGGNLTFNLGSGAAYPYLTGGTGILTIDPESRPKSEHIYLSGGAGLKFSLDNRLSLQFGVENMWYRYNPASTFFSDSDLQVIGVRKSEVRDKEVGNWALTAGVTGYLGGRNPARMSALDRDLQSQLRGGFRGISLIVEPTVGIVQFSDKLPYRADQRVAGGSAGFDFGPYVGIRGFYLRGLEEDEWSSFDTFAMYGGEMKFRLNDAATGIVPYLSLGAGYIDVNNQYEGRQIANDQPFAVGGGGVELRLSDNVKLFGSAKAVLVSSEDLSDVTSTESIQSSWMFNGGLSFALGSKRETRVVRYTDSQGQIRVAETERDREIRELREQIALAERRAMISPTDTTRFITLPILEDGEIYIRFGKTGAMKVVPEEAPREVVRETVVMGNSGLNAVDIEQLRTMIQSILRETLIENGIITSGAKAARADTVVIEKVIERDSGNTAGIQQGGEAQQTTVRSDQQRQQTSQGNQESGRTELQIKVEGPESVKVDEKAIEDRVLRRIEEQRNDTVVQSLQRQIALMQQRLDSLQSTGGTPQQVVITGDRVSNDEQSSDPNSIEKLNLEGLSATAGFNLAGKPFQFLFGVRADYGDIIGGRFRLAPDATIGIINTASYNLNVNLLTDIRVDSFDPWKPYAGFGLGLLGFSEPPSGVKGVQGTLNLLVGAEKPTGKNNALFVEYVNMNLFKFNRLQAGYRFRFEAK